MCVPNFKTTQLVVTLKSKRLYVEIHAIATKLYKDHVSHIERLTFEWFVLKYGTHICVSLRMNCNKFGHPLTFHPVPFLVQI